MRMTTPPAPLAMVATGSKCTEGEPGLVLVAEELLLLEGGKIATIFSVATASHLHCETEKFLRS